MLGPPLIVSHVSKSWKHKMKGKKCNIEIMGFGEGSNKLNYELIAEHLTQIVMTNFEKYQLDLHLQATTSV